MPKYDYKCEECDKAMVVNHKHDYIAEVFCEKCNVKMIKQISKPTVVFKGKGFYSTDK